MINKYTTVFSDGLIKGKITTRHLTPLSLSSIIYFKIAFPLFLKNYLLHSSHEAPPIPFFPYIFATRFDYIWSISSTLFPLILN